MKLFFVSTNFHLLLSFLFCLFCTTQNVSAQASNNLSAVLTNNQVALTWTNTIEDEVDYFTIERSLNGRQWEVLVQVESNHSAMENLKYQATDIEPYEGISFYRLVQTNYDGVNTLSNNVEVLYEVSMDEFFMSQDKAVTKMRKSN